ncbi:TVP38/TMEM64 family protein [Desulfovibrio litoralis]|uniref:TVP38/TMEM64 family membrane protein n=1 Tax=Desulfovibrio litoralis DSM 11393 TaxID=1121455 RepID=A0A1M7SZ37_9BACT|nr:VTT domain-containing protein [Desulfovibrio litoralis]SHN63775.1 Uncharacterized membrane protein YdjX, TVP38/TMEM64 family, SNARE-associated domain [Desulfovibrio litoralis DSM 11393]
MKLKLKLWLNGGVLFFTIAVVVLYLHFGNSDSWLELSWVDTNIREHGIQGILIFLVLCAFTTGIGIPRQILSSLAGYAFGATLGTVWALTGSILGSMLGFFFARFFAREALNIRFGKRLDKLNKVISQAPFLMIFIIRCMPMTMNVLTNLLGGVIKIKPRIFFSASALGYLPQTLIFAILGSGMRVNPILRTSVSLVLFLMSSGLGVYLYNKYKKKLLINDNISQE